MQRRVIAGVDEPGRSVPQLAQRRDVAEHQGAPVSGGLQNRQPERLVERRSGEHGRLLSPLGEL